MTNAVVVVQNSEVDAARANEVAAQLRTIRKSVEGSFFDTCYLLNEAQENSYHTVFGYSRFGDWVEEGSGLDMSARQAFYLINIAKKSRDLGLTRADLMKLTISKVKAIFELEPSEYPQEMRTMVAAAPETPLEEVKSQVRKLRGRPDSVYMTLKFDQEIKDTVTEAFELARRNYGSVVVTEGEVGDISDSKCMELICASYLQDPNNHPEDDGQGEIRTTEFDDDGPEWVDVEDL